MGNEAKILIIGYKGNLGSQLMEVFKGGPAAVEGVGQQELDIASLAAVEKVLTQKQPGLVINAAAFNDVDGCEDEEIFKRAQAINVQGPANLAKVCRQLGATLVHYSTDYVFAGDQPEGYRETDQPAPISRYGESKAGGERAVQEAGGSHYIIRTSKLFGPAGASPNAKKSFFDIMLGLAEKQEQARERGEEVKPLEVVDEEKSCFTYTRDLARSTQELVQAPQKYAFGIYHLVNEGAATWYEAAQKVFEIAGKTVKVEPVSATRFPRPAKRPAFSELLNTRGPKMRKWEEAAREYLSNSL